MKYYQCSCCDFLIVLAETENGKAYRCEQCLRSDCKTPYEFKELTPFQFIKAAELPIVNMVHAIEETVTHLGVVGKALDVMEYLVPIMDASDETRDFSASYWAHEKAAFESYSALLRSSVTDSVTDNVTHSVSSP